MKWQAWGIALLPTALLAPIVFGGSKDAQVSATKDPQAAGVGTDERAHGLTRVGEADQPARGATDAFDAAAWKSRLTDRDLDARERAFEEISRALRGDERARRTVEDWSRDAANPDLAWTSRLLLRDARTNAEARGGRGFGLAPGQRLGDLRSRLDELHRGFGGLDSMFDDMQRELDRAFGGSGPIQPFGPGSTPGGGNSGGLRRQAQSYSMQMGPDGVKVEIQEDVDGKQETKTYTAKTLDELYDAHPELKERMGLRLRSGSGGANGRGFWFDSNGPDVFGGDAWPPFGDDGRLQPVTPRDGRVPTDRLGVMVDEKASIDRAKLKIDDGVGLSVRSVQDGTIAHRIGIEAGDVIVDVNGHAIRGVDDVRGALASRKIDEDVTVTLIDAQGKRRTLTWRASSLDEKDAKREEKARSF